MDLIYGEFAIVSIGHDNTAHTKLISQSWAGSDIAESQVDHSEQEVHWRVYTSPTEE